MPEDLRDAYRYGNWDIVGGNYFKEFTAGKHTISPFRIPDHWPRYRSFDYGLDMCAVGWYAIDEDGRTWLYRTFERKGLIVSEAAAEIKKHTLPNERITVTYAPPDLWARSRDSGRAMAETFLESGVPIVRADNNRVQGHMLVKEAMSSIPLKDKYVIQVLEEKGITVPDMLPGLVVFDTLEKIISDIRDIQADETNPNDCAKIPHEVTHTIDQLRYLIISRVMAAEAQKRANELEGEEEETREEYEKFMTGGNVTSSYMRY